MQHLGKELVEDARAQLEDVDEVDPARALRIVPALHLDEWRDRMSRIRNEQVAVRPDLPQDQDRQR